MSNPIPDPKDQEIKKELDQINCISDQDAGCPFVLTGTGELTKDEVFEAKDEAEKSLNVAEDIIEAEEKTN